MAPGTIKGLRLHVRPALDSTELRMSGSPLSLLLWPEFRAMETGSNGGQRPCWEYFEP
jgi:hypothetical protein